MLDGVCPKCRSHEVYSGADLAWKMNSYGMNAIPIKETLLTSRAALDNYVCVRCGYVESHISDTRKLEEIARNWPKVPTS